MEKIKVLNSQSTKHTVIKCPHEKNTDSILTSAKKIPVFWWGVGGAERSPLFLEIGIQLLHVRFRFDNSVWMIDSDFLTCICCNVSW